MMKRLAVSYVLLLLAGCQTIAPGSAARYHHLHPAPIAVEMPPSAPYLGQQFRRLPRELARERDVKDHLGLDVQAARGTPVLAVAPGRVIRVHSGPAYGKRVEIEHAPDGRGRRVVSRYFHLDSQTVVAGQQVARGEQIGTLGHSGFLAGTLDHLHYSVLLDGRAEDPNLFWIAGVGKVSCFRPGEQVDDSRFQASYPLSC